MRLVRTVRLKRLWLRDGMAFERAAEEMEFALRNDDDNAKVRVPVTIIWYTCNGFE